nr:iron uptake transporter permease EfeU [Mycolicibacterium sphagni]
MFVGTFLIGLREGLEATLIVSIVGAFLRRNGRSIRPMMVGVGVAVGLSIAVGVGLDALSASLPQRQQEMLETVIGAVAVVFVTTMIIWMNRNAQHLKGELESEAAQAINTGGSLALAVMAFLAVLKEGFETAVFLLAAAQATHESGWAALLGALAGIAVSIVIGIGIYFGGLKLNLGRFFRITGVFLVFIAAGLVLSALRTAHEAGWINIGQQQVFDFSSWMPARSMLGSLITGMFGIPSDPRLIEVLGWLLYAVPVLVVFLWPARLAASPIARRRLLACTAAGLASAAAILAVAVPAQHTPTPGLTRTVGTADGGSASVSLQLDRDAATLTVGNAAPIPLSSAGTGTVGSLQTQLWQAKAPADPGVNTSPVSLGQLATLSGGRLPVGLSPTRTPGPFQADWTATTSYSVASYGNSLISAQAQSNRVAVLQGGGLATTKTVSLGGLGGDWSTATADDTAAATALGHLAVDRAESALWRLWLPILLAAAAAATAVLALRADRSSPTKEDTKEERHHHNHDPAAHPDQIRAS